MKCLKCGYLGFETGDRCRNCGYDFSLTGLVADSDFDDPIDDDLALEPEPETAGPLADILLGADFDEAPPPAPPPPPELSLDLDKLIGAPEPARPVLTPSADGTLFGDDTIAEDAGIPRPRAAPRPPLAVRRSTPVVPRVRPRSTPRTTRHYADDTPPLAGLGLGGGPETLEERDETSGASLVRRVIAALLDLAVLGAIDGIALYFTLRLAGVTPAEVGLLPLVPLASFFLLLNGGYFITFAALGGQTIGQMAFGLKVVGSDGLPVAFGTATVRTAAWLASTLPLGVGLWFALAPGHRALHDRLTATRVVPA